MNAIQPIQSSLPADAVRTTHLAAARAHGHASTASPAPAADTLEISSAGKAALNRSPSTPAEEAGESRAQTVQEAAHGDAQAARKLSQAQLTGSLAVR